MQPDKDDLKPVINDHIRAQVSPSDLSREVCQKIAEQTEYGPPQFLIVSSDFADHLEGWNEVVVDLTYQKLWVRMETSPLHQQAVVDDYYSKYVADSV